MSSANSEHKSPFKDAKLRGFCQSHALKVVNTQSQSSESDSLQSLSGLQSPNASLTGDVLYAQKKDPVGLDNTSNLLWCDMLTFCTQMFLVWNLLMLVFTKIPHSSIALLLSVGLILEELFSNCEHVEFWRPSASVPPAIHPGNGSTDSFIGLQGRVDMGLLSYAFQTSTSYTHA